MIVVLQSKTKQVTTEASEKRKTCMGAWRMDKALSIWPEDGLNVGAVGVRLSDVLLLLFPLLPVGAWPVVVVVVVPDGLVIVDVDIKAADDADWTVELGAPEKSVNEGNAASLAGWQTSVLWPSCRGKEKDPKWCSVRA